MKPIIISIIVVIGLIGGASMLSKKNAVSAYPPPSEGDKIVSNVTVENGVQVISIRAKGGYQPRKSIAKADLPTVIRFNTSGTFDCSASVAIPSLKIRQTLPMSGVTDINIGNPKLGLLKGSCGMGMYPFEIDFQS